MKTHYFRLSRPTPQLLPLLLLLALPTDAQFLYTNENGGITITRYTGPDGPVVIPETIDGLPVTRIGNSAFAQSIFNSVVIPNSVISIGRSAFENCFQLAEVAIGNGVTNIEYGAFANCGSLASLVIPDSVVTIGEWAFFSSGLSRISVGDGVTTIGPIAFSFCSNLKSITLGRNVGYIGDLAFTYCTSLTGVYFKGNAPNLGNYVFEQHDKTIVYYMPETTGWSETLGGRTAVLWNPRIVTDDSSFGVRGAEFGFTITGSRDFVVVVEACTDLAHPVWARVATNTLAAGFSSFREGNRLGSTAQIYRLSTP